MMNYEKLIIWQYRNKPKAYETLKLYSEIFKGDFDTLLKFPFILDVATATGKNLDLVGKHVGVNRIVDGFTYKKFFGFYNSENSLGFSRGGEGGGRWYKYSKPLTDKTLLEDEEFRWLIYSKIFKNNQTATIDNVINACKVLFGEDVSLKDNLNMTAIIYIPKNLTTEFTRWAVENLDILPRQAGVKYFFNVYDKEKTYFGFYGYEQAEPFNKGKFYTKNYFRIKKDK